MRIAVVVPYYKPAFLYGGPARSIPAMCEGLASLGAEVTVLTTDANGDTRLEVPLGRPVEVDGVTVWYFPLTVKGRFFYSRPLAAACQAMLGNYDLVVLETLWLHAMRPAVSACVHAARPYVVPLRSQLQPWALQHKFWRKRLYLALGGWRFLNGAAAIHCTHPGETETAAALGLKPPTFVVPNGVDALRYDSLPPRGLLRAKLGIPEETLMLLFLGRLSRHKRPDLAVEALAGAQGLTRQVYLVVAGPDEENLSSVLRIQSQARGCGDRLELTGLLKSDEVLSALADADLLLMPSGVQENFGMAAVEAMAAGLPILTSQMVPVGRWAEEEGAGQTVLCDATSFAEAARTLLSNPSKLKAMGNRGRLLVKKRFDLPVVARQMYSQYRSIAFNGRPLKDCLEE